MPKRVPNKCIYCQGTGMTKEHYWNRWSKKYSIPKNTKEDAYHMHYVHGIDGSKRRKKWDGHSIDHSMRKVCKTCNGGWLKLVGERAEPVVKNLIKNRPDHLTDEEKLALATWVTTFAMTFEYRDTKTKTTPQWERQYVADNQRPPPTWHIWLSIGDTSWDVRVKHAFLGGQLRSVNGVFLREIEGSQVTTRGLNNLLFHAFSTRLPISPTLHESFSRFGPQTIWPIQDTIPLNWNAPIGGADAENLHYRTFNLAFPGYPISETDWARDV